MAEFEKTPLWVDVRKIFNSGPNPVRYEYQATLHTEKEDFKLFKVVTVDMVRDYVNNIGDHVNIAFIMPLGDYIKRLYPYRDNLELTLHRQELNEAGQIVAKNKPTESERYKAVFLTESNKNIKASEYESIDKFTLDLMDILTVNLQLMNRSLEPLRIKTVGGIFKQVTQKELIHGLLAGESLKVLVDGKPSVDGLDLVEPDNQEVKAHVIIPHGTPITAIPSHQQERMNGVYTGGIGTYLQNYDNKRLWFVYPLFKTTRFKEKGKKIIFYAVPQNRFPSVERTYREESEIIYAIATSAKRYQDKAEADMMDSGSGFRQVEARSLMSKPVEMTADGPVGVRAQLNHEVTKEGRKDGLNYAPMSDRDVSSNPFAQYSRILQKSGGRVDFVWQNAKPSLIYPGMPCKYVFLSGDKVRELQGVVIFNHIMIQLEGEGMTAKNHTTLCQITLFVERLVENPTNAAGITEFTF